MLIGTTREIPVLLAAWPCPSSGLSRVPLQPVRCTATLRAALLGARGCFFVENCQENKMRKVAFELAMNS